MLVPVNLHNTHWIYKRLMLLSVTKQSVFPSGLTLPISHLHPGNPSLLSHPDLYCAAILQVS